MPEENLDIKSPYFKHKAYSAHARGENFISLDQNLEKMKETSDNLLRRKITNISKRVVGEEIRKFSEIASQEISEEFTNLEERIQNNTLRYTKNFLEKNLDHLETAMQKDIYERMDSLQDNLENSLDTRIRDLNDLLYDIEEKLESFETLSEQINEKLDSLEYLEEINSLPEEEPEGEEVLETPAFKISKTRQKNSTEKLEADQDNQELKNSSIIILGSSSHSQVAPTLLLAEPEADQEEADPLENIGEISIKTKEREEKTPIKKQVSLSSIEDEMKKVISAFDKKGFLFKKNNFTSHFKNLKVNDFLQKTNYSPVDKADEAKMEAILQEKISKSKNIPTSEERIEEFLRRCLA